LALVVVALACGAALQSATGFGFSLLAAPLLFAALDPPRAVGLLAALGLLVNALTLGTERRRPAPLAGDVRAILLAAPAGALVGVVVLRTLDALALQLLVGAAVVAALAARRAPLHGPVAAAPAATGPPAARPAWSAPLAGLLAGGLGTATSTSGPPLLLHLLGRGAHPATVRDTLSVCFLGLGLLSPLVLLATRTPGAVPDPRLLALGAPAILAGHLAGRRGFARLVARGHYERAVTALLLVAVVAGLAGVVLGA
jgi:uncharacterized protein